MRLILELICMILVLVNAYFAFVARRKKDETDMIWSLAFMLLAAIMIGY